MRALLLVAVACACGGARSIELVSTPPQANETLAASLEREIGVGKPVAIVAGKTGVVAISADGARQRVLASGLAKWVLVDSRSNVVWFGSEDGTAFRAIDLDAPVTAPIRIETVVTGLPSPNRAEMVGPVSFGVTYPDPNEPMGAAAMNPDFALGSCCATASVTLFVMKDPSVSGGTGYQSAPEWQEQLGHAAIPGRAFLITLASRADHRIPSADLPPATNVAAVDPKNCEDPDECGKAEPIVGARYLRVVVAHATGDVGHRTWRVYDADVKRFVDAEWGTWLQNAWAAPDGSAFIANGVVVRFDTGPLAATPANETARGGGWLGGGVFYGY
jgi:hypothetical protein